jgi:hypothetical protein
MIVSAVTFSCWKFLHPMAIGVVTTKADRRRNTAPSATVLPCSATTTAVMKVSAAATATHSMIRRGTLEVQKARRVVKQNMPVRTMRAVAPLQPIVSKT